MVGFQVYSSDMNWLTEQQKEQIRKLAGTNPEEETCGFVMPDGSVIQVPNTAKNPKEEFRIEASTVAEYAEAVGCWHSHLEMERFSVRDQLAIHADGQMPWAVYTLSSNKFCECDPLSYAPYEGRPYVWGIWDCYSLICDWLERERDVRLPEWERGTWGEWDEPHFKPFDEEWSTWCRRVDEPRVGDILLFNVGSHHGHTDHVGVVTTNHYFLHHPASKLSCKSRLGSHWLRRVNSIVRPIELCSS